MNDTQTLQYYSQNASSYAADTSKRSMAAAIDWFSSFLQSDANVIDIGCGGGRDLRAFRRQGFNAVGLDVSAELAAIAAEFSGCPVVIADMRAMPFASGCFDAVWAAASLLHIDHEDIPAALAEIRRVLKPGAYFFSSVKQGDGQRREADGRLFSYFRRDEWSEFQARVGLSVFDHSTDDNDAESPDRSWVSTIARRI